MEKFVYVTAENAKELARVMSEYYGIGYDFLTLVSETEAILVYTGCHRLKELES